MLVTCHVSRGSPLWNCGALEVPEEKEATHEKLMLLVGRSAVPDVRSPGLCLYAEIVRKCFNLVKQVTLLKKVHCPQVRK